MLWRKKKPLILVTNDDGIYAKGIQSLVEVMLDFGRVLVVAPDSPQSGMGHAVTINNILRLEEVSFPVSGVWKAFSTSGTPVDCVKLAIYAVLKGEKPDLLVSGINHGANSSINVIYSGTMSAAVEGAVESIPSMGFSLLDHDEDAHFKPGAKYIRRLTQSALKHGIPAGTCLNVNIPKLPASKIKGIKVCRQAKAFWKDAFEERKAPNGSQYFWLTGEFNNSDRGEDTDEWALHHGFISVVPTHFDMTDHHAIADLNQWEL